MRLTTRCIAVWLTAVACGPPATKVDAPARTDRQARSQATTTASGTVIGWGENDMAQLPPPGGSGTTGVIAIAAGYGHSLALQQDGTIVAWGDDRYGQATVPSLTGAVAIAAGGFESVALRNDGTVVAWGDDGYGQRRVPTELTGVTAIATGGLHTLALRNDGTVVGWGYDYFGQATNAAGLTGVTAVAAGGFHSLALRNDGTVVAWGWNEQGQATVPAGLGGVVAIAAGLQHSLALKADGTVVGWGLDFHGQATVPTGLTGVVAIAAGEAHSLALKADGTVVAWGYDGSGQATVPAGLTGVIALAAGRHHSLALRRDAAPASGDELFVANFENGTITVFDLAASGDVAPLRTLSGPSTRLGNPVSLALDRAANELYVGSQYPDSIAVFSWDASGDATPSRVIAGPSTQLAAPTGLAIDAVHREILVANYYSNRITVYPLTASGDAAPIRVIEGPSTGLIGPFGLALDLVHDEIVVTSGSRLRVYGRTTSGDSAALRTLETSGALGSGVSLEGDEVFVADRVLFAVAAYSRTGNGPVSPLGVISGSATGLAGPTAVLAHPPTGQLFVGNLSSHAVTVYPTSASGNVTPLRTIQGASTGLRQPHGFAIRNAGTFTLSVTRSGSGSITSAPAAIDCGATCSADLPSGAIVGLTAAAAAGSTFAGWSGACSGSGTCIVPMDGAKTVDATFVATAGSSCTSSADCATGLCVDGLCCDRACSGQCEACDVPGSVGTCVPVVGAPHGARAACATDGTACGGTCDGSSASSCAYPGPATACRAASCSGGVATLAGVCGGAGACAPVQTQTCDPFVCGPTACLAACSADADCLTGNVCVSGTCLPEVLILGVTPSSGPAAGGTTVFLKLAAGGASSLGASVTIGGVPATDVVEFPPSKGTTSVACTTPPGAPGAADVVVTLADGRRAVAPGGFQYVAGPTISSITPASGPTSGGTTVTITGSGFVSGASVSFGSTAAPAIVADASTIVATTGPGLAGAVDVVIHNPDGRTATLARGFTYANAPVPGHVVAWGDGTAGKTAVPAVLGEIVAIAAGWYHTAALRPDGTVVSWGDNAFGQAAVPSDLAGVTAVAAGRSHTLALRSDGTVVAWGNDVAGATSVPAGLAGVVAVAAGADHSVALRSDGTVVAWGNDQEGEASVPAGLGGVRAIAAGYSHTVALRSDGTVVAWGSDVVGESTVPAGLSGVAAVAAGYLYTVALKVDGTVVAWGGAATVPSGLSDVSAVAAGYSHTVALRNDGTIVAWGSNQFGESSPPSGLSSVTAIAAGNGDTIAVTTTPPPVAAAIEPASATTAGGPATVAGSGFQAGATVTIGGAAATVASLSATSISVAAPPHAAGVVDVVVSNPDGQSSTLAGAFTYTQALALASLTPSSGPAAGGTAVSLTGAGFQTGMTVTFGTTSATSVSVADASHATCVTPPGTGTVDVRVTTPSGTSTLPAAFTYVPRPTITSVTPNSGSTLGGTAITIAGTSFLPGASVTVGGAAAVGVTVVSPTQITAFTPPHAAASVGVSVTNPNGQARNLAGAFTYVAAPAPVVQAISPVSGPIAGGTPVTVTGSSFAPGATLTLGGVAATNVAVVSATTITGVTGAHASGNVNVVVRNPDNQAGTLTGGYRYLNAPTISGLNVTRGPVLGGTAVAISGSGFQSGASVTFDGLPATVTSLSGGTLRVTTPPHPAVGTVNVIVRNVDGQSASAANAFTYVPAAPTGLMATGGQQQVSLSWTAAAGASGYDVFVAGASSGPYGRVGSTAATTFISPGADGTRYYYRVQATSGSGSSADSNTANAWTLAAPPTGVTATPGSRRIALSWTAMTGATRYTVSRATVSGGPYTVVGSPTGTTFTNTGLTTGTTYYYVIQSRDPAGLSLPSAEVSATAR